MTSWIGVFFVTTQALLVYAEQLHDITICGVELKDVLFNRTPNRRYFGEGCDYYFGKNFFPAIYPYEKINDSFQVQSSEGCWLSAARFGGGSEEDDITSKAAQCAERRKYEWRLFYETDFTAGIVSDQLWVADPRFPLTVIPGTGGLFLFGNETYGRKGLFELDVNEYGAYQCCMRISQDKQKEIVDACRTSDRLQYLKTLDFCKGTTDEKDIRRTTSLPTPSTSSSIPENSPSTATTSTASISSASNPTSVKPECPPLKVAHNSLCPPTSVCYELSHESYQATCQGNDQILIYKKNATEWEKKVHESSFVTCQANGNWNLAVDGSYFLCHRIADNLEKAPTEKDGIMCKQLPLRILTGSDFRNVRYFYNQKNKRYSATCHSGVLITETGQNAPDDVVCDGDNKWVNLNTNSAVSTATCLLDDNIACAGCGNHGNARISMMAGACYAMCNKTKISYSVAGDGDEIIFKTMGIRCGSSHIWEVPIDNGNMGKMVQLKPCT